MNISNSDYLDLLMQFEEININESEFKKTIYGNPFSSTSIFKILKDEYKLVFEDFPNGGFCNFITKLIRVSKNIGGFQRDVTICHEAVHAFYGFISWDLYMDLEGCKNNKIMTEFLARKIRSSPECLASILEGFNVPSEIYDESSLLANNLRSEVQLYFPFLKDFIPPFVMMDFSNSEKYRDIAEYF